MGSCISTTLAPSLPKAKLEFKNSHGKYISLAPDLKPPQNREKMEESTQAYLLELKVNGERMDYGIKKKTLVLGSSENVKFCGQKGFFSTVVAAYNNHYILRTCPEDWWMSIRKVSTDWNQNTTHSVPEFSSEDLKSQQAHAHIWNLQRLWK